MTTLRKRLSVGYWYLKQPRLWRIVATSWWTHWRSQQADLSKLTVLDEADFDATRTSDTVFVFGSGYSLNAITPDEWAYIAQHNTIGFSMFVYQDFVRVDYHLFRELYVGHEFDKSFWLPYTQEFIDYVESNPHYADTILFLQRGWRALTVNRILTMKLFNKPHRVVWFHTGARGSTYPPTARLSEGLVHGAGSLTDALNLAIVGGWKDIVLAGVDLYDSRYFWDREHHAAEDFGRSSTDTHNTVNNGIIENIRLWRDVVAERGITLWVYNPKSLLTEVLPVYDVNQKRATE